MEYKTVICPVSDPELLDAAVKQASYICKISGAKLILLNVVEKWYRSADVVSDSAEWQHIHEEWLNKGREILEKVRHELKEQGLNKVEVVLREGDAAHEIIAQALENRADLIIMVSHRYSPIGKFFMGGIIDKVSKHAPCPVMWVFK